MTKEQNTKELNLEIPTEVLEGVFSNLMFIAHSNSEFIVDFARILPGIDTAKVKSRIIMTPIHAKKLLKILSENIAKFEEIYGEIKDFSPNIDVNAINFGGPNPEA